MLQFHSRGPMKYTRKWEDESAYTKQTMAPPIRNPRPEDFPELGSKVDRRSKSINLDREEKENKSRPNYQIDDDNRNYPKKRNSIRQLSDRRDSDRRDSDRRDGRDNSRSRRPHDRYSSTFLFLFVDFFFRFI